MELDIRSKKEELLAYIAALEEGKKPEFEMHESDIAEVLMSLRSEHNEAEYDHILHALPPEILGATVLELPEKHQQELTKSFEASEWADVINELETDDATDIVQQIEDIDKDKAYEIMRLVDTDHKEDIENLKRFDDDSAGAIMQTELFSARLDEPIESSIRRLREMLSAEELSNIHYVFVVDESNKLKAMLTLEELIMLDLIKRYSDSIAEFDEPIFVHSTDSIETVTQTVERYDLAVIPVVDHFGHLLGRITSDDIYDLIEDQATEQIYSLGQVGGDSEIHDGVIKSQTMRAKWLLLNLFSASLGAFVISLFSDSIEQIVALASLMPIVASMGGVSGTQTLTIMVRQMALGELKLENALGAIGKEMVIALLNGIVFATLAGALAWAWFKMPLLGAVIAMAMLANMLYAGLFGAGIPLVLKRFGIDPAVASAVLLITVTDVAGFFTFLSLATIILL